MTVTGILHPGQMGATIAATCSGTTLWASAGRTAATRRRAEDAGLTDAETVAGLVERADTIVSVCPPARAVAVAQQVADAGFAGVYVDANAVSPTTAAVIAELFEHYVDGGIIGPPAHLDGTTRMYLSGHDAAAVAERWAGSVLDVRVVDGGVGAASALKMCFAGWTKGSTALLLAINAAAQHYEVHEALFDEWAISIPDQAARSDGAARAASPKAWRFEGEMREIAATFVDAGLPAGFHQAAAEIFGRMTGFRAADAPPDLDTVIAALLDADGVGPS